jgi:phage terminase large subunit-like protein
MKPPVVDAAAAERRAAQDAANLEAGLRVTAYAKAVIAGDVVAGELLRLAAERHMRDLETADANGWRFDLAAAGKGIRFFPMLLRHYKGEWGPKGLPNSPAYVPGKPIELLDWEAFLIGSLEGWFMRNPEPGHAVEWIRRFTIAYTEVGKKNGKSLIAAGVGIKRTFYDGEAGAEGYTIATKRDQARLVWTDADKMVAASPILSRKIQRSAKTLSDPLTSSKFAPLSAEERGEEGINPHIVDADELHRYADGQLFEMIENSFGARLQPLLFIITTAGEPGENVWAHQRKLAEQILRGQVVNERFFALVYAIDPDDDPFDETVWPKANPSMPVTPKLEEMRQRAIEAKASPSKLNSLLRLRLNRPMSVQSRFFDVTTWGDPDDAIGRANSAKPIDPPEDAPLAWAGLDLGLTRDLSAFGLWIPRQVTVGEDSVERYDVIVRAWAPEKAAERRGDGLYEHWAEDGFLTLTDGDIRDDEAIEADILELANLCEVRRFSYDRYGAAALVVRLQRAGLPVEPLGQGWVSMSPALKELERLYLAGLLNHGGNPLLAWAVSNADSIQDTNGNIRLKKPTTSSPDKIDPVSAVLDAVAGWLGDRDELPSNEMPGFAFDGYDGDTW